MGTGYRRATRSPSTSVFLPMVSDVSPLPPNKLNLLMQLYISPRHGRHSITHVLPSGAKKPPGLHSHCSLPYWYCDFPPGILCDRSGPLPTAKYLINLAQSAFRMYSINGQCNEQCRVLTTQSFASKVSFLIRPSWSAPMRSESCLTFRSCSVHLCLGWMVQ